MRLYITFVITAVIDASICNTNLVKRTLESCAGITGHNFLSPSCMTDEIIYVSDVYTYAKTINSGCPQLQTSFNISEECCTYSDTTSDCGMRYYGQNGDLTVYSDCSGVGSCTKPVSWNDTRRECDQAVFLPQTNYMEMSFYCIKETSVCNICNCTKTCNLLYLLNDGYPGPVDECSMSSGCTCTVKSSGSSKIRIDSFDVRFQVNSNTSTCAQRLHIRDGGTEFDIACDDNNAFSKRTVYYSSTSSVTIRLDNTINTNNSHFWVQINAVDPSQFVTIDCSREIPVYGCNDSFVVISGDITEMTFQPVELADKNNIMVTAIGIIIGIVLLGTTVVCIVLLKKRYKVIPKVDSTEETVEDEKDDDINDNEENVIPSLPPDGTHVIIISVKTEE